MTQDNSSQDNAASQTGGGDLFNTAAGWVLFAGVVGLGLVQLSKGYFHGDKPERPEKLGYVIEGAVEEGAGPAEASIADALNAMSGHDHLMVIAATRYCLGRMTYVVGDCCDWLRKIWPILSEATQKIIRRDIEEAFARDDADREAGREFKALGHDCDRKQWERVRNLWKGKQND